MLYLAMGTTNECIMYNIVCVSYYFSPQVKNKPYEPLGTMCLLLSSALYIHSIGTVDQLINRVAWILVMGNDREELWYKLA